MAAFRLLWPYLARHKQILLLGVLFVTISNICSTTIPRFVGQSIDTIKVASVDKNSQAIQNDLPLSIAAILGLTVGSGFFMFLTRRTIIVTSRNIEFELRRDLLASIENQSRAFFNRNPTGNLMALATNDISAAREFLGPAIMYTANTITTFTFALTYMLLLSPTMTGFALLPLPIIAWLTYAIGRKVHVAFMDVQSTFAGLSTEAQEVFSGIRVVQTYNREEHERDVFQQQSELYRKKNMRLARLSALTMPSMMVLIGLSNLFVLVFGGIQVIEGAASIGTLTQFFLYINQLIWPVAAIGWVSNLIQRASASSKRIFAIMDSVSELVTESNYGGPRVDSPDIEFNCVSFSYPGSTKPALKGVSFKVPSGSTLGIVGATGSGKSTILSLMTRQYDPESGDVLLSERPVRSYDLRSFREHFAVVTQESFLFSMSLRDNIAFGRPTATTEEIVRAARQSAIADEIASFPQGYDTVIGERGVTLSGGQRQRTAIARALVSNAPVIILDDSLSAVDAETEEKILESIRAIAPAKTCIITSHRMSVVRACDNIIVLRQGKIVESGTHTELIDRAGLYAEMVERQQLEEELRS